MKFLKPVRVDDTLIAEASVDMVKGRKYTVNVHVMRAGEPVFEGVFVCFVLEKHVLT